VSFKEAPVISQVVNFSKENLWYPGYAVECDRCEQPVHWGEEGSYMGSPGQSRFAQGQVFCNACVAEKLYSELGVWLIVALAAGSNTGGVSYARDNMCKLLEQLCGMASSARADQLVSLLGREVEDREVRTVVLQKAHRGALNASFGTAPAACSAARVVKEELRERGPQSSKRGPPEEEGQGAERDRREADATPDEVAEAGAGTAAAPRPAKRLRSVASAGPRGS